MVKESDGVLKFEEKKSGSCLITHPKICLLRVINSDSFARDEFKLRVKQRAN